MLSFAVNGNEGLLWSIICLGAKLWREMKNSKTKISICKIYQYLIFMLCSIQCIIVISFTWSFRLIDSKFSKVIIDNYSIKWNGLVYDDGRVWSIPIWSRNNKYAVGWRCRLLRVSWFIKPIIVMFIDATKLFYKWEQTPNIQVKGIS